MKTSESIINIAEALAVAQGKIKNPECNETVVVTMKAGGSYSYKYATLPKCFDATREPFAANGLSHTSDITFEANGRCRLCVRLSHKTGEWYESEMYINHSQADKDLAGTITFWKRYLFNGMAGIAGDEDPQTPDGDRGPTDSGKSSRGGKDRASWGNQYDKEEATAKPSPGPKLPPQKEKAAAPAAGEKTEPKEPTPEELRMTALKAVMGAATAAGWQNDQVSALVLERYKAHSVKKLSVESLKELEATLRTEMPPAPSAPAKSSTEEFDKLPEPKLK